MLQVFDYMLIDHISIINSKIFFLFVLIMTFFF